jgi:hypothetical protein
MAGLFGLHNPNPPTLNHDTWVRIGFKKMILKTEV